jgi:hypothetical protein
MIEWCRNNLMPHAPGFEFAHHDVFHVSLNPGDGKPMTLPFPAPDRSFTLVEATSVFTHVVESQARYYIREVARILAEDESFTRRGFSSTSPSTQC